ncbi:hypothetical protein PR202_gb07006 [Eleusine coracana subsp. coracana]|uniref:F-box domain-containing protein n=1 Tax=Eleusine coracana subsp. coracana TaxID=191504 RepID=A0AAV5E9A5_ELECO|nr:hypothetical protein QOZ80_2BG0164940 [Eleusine coracana subsp. coracana]GJN19704.1 hypothetical protein PR202_gb07006 [Eleusine coracana subsp. coracana]
MKRGKREEKSSSPPAAAAEAAVLGNDDLLREILVRLDHPTCLVHAALVSRRWLRHASDPAFLRRFRGLHPPRLLGLYVHGSLNPSRFVPVPHPRELDVVFRRANFHLENGLALDCRNGRVLVFLLAQCQTGIKAGFLVCSPLHQTPIIVVAPLEEGSHFFLPADGGNGMCCNIVNLVCGDKKISAEHFVMQAGAKSEVRTSATIELPSNWQRQRCMDGALLVNNKCYILGNVGYILGLDLASMCLCVIDLPDGVQQHGEMKNITLSQADGSGFHLIHLNGFQIQVWHHNDSDYAGEWQLVNTICVRRAIAHLAMSDYWEFTLKLGSSQVRLHRVGDNAEFLLNLGREFFHMYIGSKRVEKVFEMPPDDNSYERNLVIHPFTTMWPPSFPALRDEQAHQSQDQ